jgi:hypothetical protein
MWLNATSHGQPLMFWAVFLFVGLMRVFYPKGARIYEQFFATFSEHA